MGVGGLSPLLICCRANSKTNFVRRKVEAGKVSCARMRVLHSNQWWSTCQENRAIPLIGSKGFVFNDSVCPISTIKFTCLIGTKFLQSNSHV